MEKIKQKCLNPKFKLKILPILYNSVIKHAISRTDNICEQLIFMRWKYTHMCL